MLLARNGIIPPKEWYHDPNIEDVNIMIIVNIKMSIKQYKII